MFVCTSHFANFAKGKWSDHDSKNCLEIRTVTCLVIWLWKLKISIFVCLFVYLFVCTSRFANFANGKWSNHDSKNCSEIRTVTWSVIWLWKLQFTILIFFTTLYCTYCCASSMLSHIAISWSILCLNDIYMDFRVVLHCKVPTPPPQVTLQLPQEPHAAQVASTADEFSYFSWHY